MNSSIILAIDLVKYKSVVCLLDPNSGEFRFNTIDTSKEELRALRGYKGKVLEADLHALLSGCVEAKASAPTIERTTQSP